MRLAINSPLVLTAATSHSVPPEVGQLRKILQGIVHIPFSHPHSVLHIATLVHLYVSALALQRAKQAAGHKDDKIGGDVSTVRQYLKDELIDSLHLASVPVLLGQGELLFEGLNLSALGFSVTNRNASEYAAHITLEKV